MLTSPLTIHDTSSLAKLFSEELCVPVVGIRAGSIFANTIILDILLNVFCSNKYNLLLEFTLLYVNVMQSSLEWSNIFVKLFTSYFPNLHVLQLYSINLTDTFLLQIAQKIYP